MTVKTMEKSLKITVFCLFTSLVAFGQDQGSSNNPDGTIGAPNGTSYVVVSTSTTTKADPANCGYNDVGAANMGIFNVEIRKYTDYQNGQINRVWTESVETFDHCYEP